jgi:hypothetical protein
MGQPNRIPTQTRVIANVPFHPFPKAVPPTSACPWIILPSTLSLISKFNLPQSGNRRMLKAYPAGVNHVGSFCTPLIKSSLFPSLSPILSQRLRMTGEPEDDYLVIEDYPSSYRMCPTDEWCDQFPCRHTPCKDPDYLVQLMDMGQNSELVLEAVDCFYIPKLLDTMSEERRLQVLPRLERYQRVHRKRHAILAEIEAWHWEKVLSETCNEK